MGQIQSTRCQNYIPDLEERKYGDTKKVMLQSTYRATESSSSSNSQISITAGSSILTLSDIHKRIIRVIKQSQGHCWIVGGAVRDSLLGIKAKDIDFATNLLPEQIKDALYKNNIPIKNDTLAAKHGIIRVISSEGLIDIATLRVDIAYSGRHVQVAFTNDIIKDLQRRDLTINAMAIEVLNDNPIRFSDIIDPYHGQIDLRSKTVVFVRNPVERIQEDALRMVRACRFTALGAHWTLNESAVTAIKANTENLSKISVERIRDEIVKAMGYPYPGNFIRFLATCGLLRSIIEPVADCVDITQNEYHSDNVYEHLLYTLDACTTIDDRPLIRLASLLHDIGKPSTKSIDSKQRIHFHKHEVAGEIIAYKWMSAYKFSKQEIRYVTCLIRHHQWRFWTNTKEKTIRRWLREVGSKWKDLIILRAADRRGNRANRYKTTITTQMAQLVVQVEELIAQGIPIFNDDLAINGHDLKELGIKPGPIYKEIFNDIWGLVIKDPNKNTKDYLKEFVIRRKYNV